MAEAGTIAAMSAIAQAVEHALGGGYGWIRSIPLSPVALLSRINAALGTPLPPRATPSRCFNRNGFTYFGVDELTKLWEHYANGPSRLIQTVAVLRSVVSSDIAWLICELKYRRVSPVTSEDHWEPANVDEVFGSKATEIYHRDDGSWQPEWKMWHLQSGVRHPAGENRPAFDDADQANQLGYNPSGPPLTCTYTLEGRAGQASLEDGIPT